MPSKSKEQAKLMRYAYAVKKDLEKNGKKSEIYKNASDKMKDIVDGMSLEQLKDFTVLKENKTTMKLLSYSDFKNSLNEAKETDSLNETLKEYAKISKELNDLYKSIKNKTDKLEKDKSELFDKIFKEMETSNKNLIAVDGAVAEIKETKGKSRTNPKYKEAFNAALTKVNEATKNILNEVLKANTTFTEATTKRELSIKLTESAIGDVWKKVKKFFVEIYENIKGYVSDQSKAVKELQKVSDKFETAINESKFSTAGELLDFLGGKDSLITVEKPVYGDDKEGTNVKQYAIYPSDLSGIDPMSITVIVTDEDGEEFEVKVSDISDIS